MITISDASNNHFSGGKTLTISKRWVISNSTCVLNNLPELIRYEQEKITIEGISHDNALIESINRYTNNA